MAASQGFSITVVPPAGAPTCLPPSVVVNSSGTNPLAVTATSNCTDSSAQLPALPSIGAMALRHHLEVPALTLTHARYVFDNCYCYRYEQSERQRVGQSDAYGAGGSGNARQPAQLSTNVSAPLGVPSVTVTYQCTNANGPSGVQTMAYYNLSCTINSGGRVPRLR